MKYVVTRPGPDGLPISSVHAVLNDAVDEVMYLHDRGMAAGLYPLPDCPTDYQPDEEY